MRPAEELIGSAQDQTGQREFDDDSFQEGLEILVAAISDCQRITDAGTARLDDLIVTHLARRLNVAQYLRENPAVLQEKVVSPIMVLGMPRTGTTAIINLLDQDPNLRTVLRWTLEQPVPPPAGDSLHTDPRCLAALAAQRERLNSGLAGANIRFEWADSPAECVHVMNHDFKAFQWDSIAPVPEYSEFLMTCSMDSAYSWHKKFLQLLQSRAPGRWALKAPSHALWIPTIVNTYPDARLVWTHRDPYTALGSLCSLITNAHRRNCDTADIDWIREWYPGVLAEHVYRPMKLLPQLGDQIFHVDYDQIVTDPIGVMERLYAWLGDDLTDDLAERMRQWLGRRRQASLGEHRYSLEEFGIDRQHVERLFGDYLDFYHEEVLAT